MTVYFVDELHGKDTNDGLTPQTAIKDYYVALDKCDAPMTKDELIGKIRGILKYNKENSIACMMIRGAIGTYDYGTKLKD